MRGYIFIKSEINCFDSYIFINSFTCTDNIMFFLFIFTSIHISSLLFPLIGDYLISWVVDMVLHHGMFLHTLCRGFLLSGIISLLELLCRICSVELCSNISDVAMPFSYYMTSEDQFVQATPLSICFPSSLLDGVLLFCKNLMNHCQA